MSDPPAAVERRPLVALTLLVALAAYGTSLLAPPSLLLPCMGLAWAATVGAATLRAPDTLQATLLLALMVSFTATVPVRVWPLPMLVPLVVFGAARLRLRRARTPLRWALRGDVSAPVAGLSLAAAALSVALWNVAARPQLAELHDALPPLDGAALVGFALMFASLNAAMEAVFARGVLQSAVEESSGAPWAGVLMPSLTLGLAHFYDVPRGVRGAVAAGASAALFGLLRLRAKGMLAPFVAQMLTYLGIFASLRALTS